MSDKTPTPKDLLASANMWTERAEAHIRAADFCHEQASRFLGHLAVPDDFRPTLTLIDGEKNEQSQATVHHLPPSD